MTKIDPHIDFDGDFEQAILPASKIIPKRNRRKEAHKERKFAPRKFDRVLPDSLKIGDRVWCHFNRTQILFHDSGGLGLWPMIVYGIYRQNGTIVAVDLLKATARFSKGLYPEEILFQNPDILAAMHSSDRPFKLQMDSLVTIPNQKRYFAAHPVDGHMPDDLWPEILVRRAQAMIYNTALKYNCCEFDITDPALVREGFTLPLANHSIRSGIISPDLPGGGFVRKHRDDLVSQEDLGRVVAFAVFYGRNGTKELQAMGGYPPFDHRPDDRELARAYPPRWENGRRVPYLPPLPDDLKLSV